MNILQRRLAWFELATQTIPQACVGRIAAIEHQHLVAVEAETDGIWQRHHLSS